MKHNPFKSIWEKHPSWKATIKRWTWFFLNPRLLLCFGIAWMITNGWCYLFILLGTLMDVRWMVAAGTTWAGLLWLPFTPEKIVTLILAMLLLKWLFPSDEKTLKLLHEEKQKLLAAWHRQKEKRRDAALRSKKNLKNS